MHEITSTFDAQRGITLTCAGWAGFRLDSLHPVLRIDGEPLSLVAMQTHGQTITCDFGQAVLTLELLPEDGGIHLRARLRNTGGEAVLNRVALLETSAASFGWAEDVRLLVQSAYFGDVVPLCGRKTAQAAAEPGSEEAPKGETLSTQNISLAYERGTRQAFLAGFLTSERWQGVIDVETDAGGAITRWSLGFDGGDLLILPGEELLLEEVLVLAGADPHALLEAYADRVAALHPPQFPALPPVSWCSWYPYRLGVTEERMLETARIAQARLAPYGFRYVEADLGWERGNLPNAFEENDRFPHGLRWLADELGKLGMELGTWKAPYTISAFDPLVREHPEWVVAGEDGQPYSVWDWFWEPHGKIYILDLTHPGAQGWLHAKIASLRDRGVRYFKADFIGGVTNPEAKRRYDRRIVAGGGCEASRIGAGIIRDALGEGALQLNCGGPELPGSGQWPLLYQCNDTGNTGFITWEFQRNNFRAVATHLYKNRRWGWIQSSCLCVGLPGTLEEARLRATAAFLSGGQIDISDTLTTLPEDRWQVLLATLPPLGESARAIDLFEPVYDPGTVDYTMTCQGISADGTAREQPAGSIWHLPLTRAWDAWHLVGAFHFDAAPTAEHPPVARFAIPLERLGLLPEERYWAYEFWSGQFLGEIPAQRRNKGGYIHPGDYQDLTVGDAPGYLDIAFAGPGVKLICLRAVRPHPWVVGSSFHQSCGTELADVRWNAEQRLLSGTLHRQPGESGNLIVAGAGRQPVDALVDGHPAILHPAANGAWRLPILTTGEIMRWEVRY